MKKQIIIISAILILAFIAIRIANAHNLFNRSETNQAVSTECPKCCSQGCGSMKCDRKAMEGNHECKILPADTLSYHEVKCNPEKCGK